MAAVGLSVWFRAAARDLPWRESTDPYRVWVAEVMLQQTTSAACVPYYRRFIARFPSVASLAGASEEEVLSLWAGLGYYSRARNLLRAAREVVTKHGGRLPEDARALSALPGIGEYTAGAIRAVAFNLPGVMWMQTCAGCSVAFWEFRTSAMARKHLCGAHRRASPGLASRASSIRQ